MRNQENMTEFTFAPSEKNIVGDRFSPSILTFWLKTSIAASSTRIQYRSPNALLNLIPLGSNTKTIPLRNVAGVETDSKFNLGNFALGIAWLVAALRTFGSSIAVGLILLLFAAADLANIMSMRVTFRDPSGGGSSITVSILEKDRLTQLAREIEKLVFADADQLRHEESMDLAQKQYTAQTNGLRIQQQMLANQRQS